MLPACQQGQEATTSIIQHSTPKWVPSIGGGGGKRPIREYRYEGACRGREKTKKLFLKVFWEILKGLPSAQGLY